MIIDYDHIQVKVPYEILEYCDRFTYDVNREDLRYVDCIYMNMGYYGNDPNHLKKMRQSIFPIFE
jgi:hypothetical protein